MNGKSNCEEFSPHFHLTKSDSNVWMKNKKWLSYLPHNNRTNREAFMKRNSTVSMLNKIRERNNESKGQHWFSSQRIRVSRYVSIWIKCLFLCREFTIKQLELTISVNNRKKSIYVYMDYHKLRFKRVFLKSFGFVQYCKIEFYELRIVESQTKKSIIFLCK